MSKCDRTAAARGIFLRTFSTHGAVGQCNIGSRSHLDHHVLIENLQVYDAEISCIASISSRPPSIRFDSGGGHPADTDDRWHASTTLTDADSKEFEHVKLLRSGVGAENIRVDVEVRWPEPGDFDHLTVTIKVGS